MTKAKYMALADFQSLWTTTIKPWIQQSVVVTYASTQTCEDIISEIT